MIKGKKAIELSVNFLVTFIIAIVIFSMGILFTRQLFGGGEELTDLTFQDLHAKIGDLLCGGGDPVCLSTKSLEIERGEYEVFGLTVKNVLPEKETFNVEVNLQVGYDQQDNKITSYTPEQELTVMYDESEFQLANRESQTIAVGIQVPEGAIKGRYVFEAKALRQTTIGKEPYPSDATYRIFVNVIG